MSNYISRHYAGIASAIGSILVIAGFFFFLPFVILPFFPDETIHIRSFVFPGGVLFFLGLVLRFIFRPYTNSTLSIQDGGIIVLVSWLLVILFSAFPFMDILGFSFSRAFFESMSGWTTTGLSVVDVSTAGELILIWRSIMQFAGGAGLAIIMMSSIMGPVGIGISNAEGRSDQLIPHVRRSSRLVLIMYLSYAIIGIVAYKVAGMSYFDAINHSFAAISTGGFSTHAESIGYWDSIHIEIVTILLMLLGSLSFITAWALFRGRIKTVLRNPEVRFIIIILPVALLLGLSLAVYGIYPTLAKSIRVTVFETISALTTTGFSTVGYSHLNSFGFALMILLMLVGGGTYSTAGGIKQHRIYIIFKHLIWELRTYLLPKSAIRDTYIWEGERKVHVDNSYVRPIVVFVLLYLFIFMIGVLVLAACGFSLQNSLFEFASALGTVGLSIGATGYSMPTVALWTEVVGMFFGRLEIVVIITSLCRIHRDCNLLFTRNVR